MLKYIQTRNYIKMSDRSRFRPSPLTHWTITNTNVPEEPLIPEDMSHPNPAFERSVTPSNNQSKNTCEVGSEGGPSGWDSSLGQHPSMRYLDVTGLRVKYKGPGSDDRDAASIRSNNPIPKGCPVYYFEVEILNKGRDGYIGIGLAVKDVKLDRLPGWEPRSYGYHGDDGHVFNGRGTGRPYGPVYTTGDWIGVIYDRIEKTITFTKKGFQLGAAFQNVPEDLLFYPTVGFRTPDEEIIVNFGDDLERRPFKGDYEGILETVMSKLYRQVFSTKMPSPDGPVKIEHSDGMAELVFDYLQHHGYWETAQVFGEDGLQGKHAISDAIRQESSALSNVTEFIMTGDSAKAMEAAEALCPGVLERNESITFSLKCQILCEMIQAKKDEDAMRYGRDELMKSCKTVEDRALLDKVLALFAYSEPESSPYGYMLGTSYKNELAASLARCLRKDLGKREVSTLEDVYRHSCVLQDLLHYMGDPASRLIHVKNFVDEAV